MNEKKRLNFTDKIAIWGVLIWVIVVVFTFCKSCAEERAREVREEEELQKQIEKDKAEEEKKNDL